MKARALILAATIAATAGSLTTLTAQASQTAPVHGKVPTSIGSWIDPQAAPVRSKVPTSIGSWIEPH